MKALVRKTKKSSFDENNQKQFLVDNLSAKTEKRMSQSTRQFQKKYFNWNNGTIMSSQTLSGKICPRLKNFSKVVDGENLTLTILLSSI